MPAICGRRHFWRTEMSDEYPKALYRGDKQAYEHVIADGDEHEAHLRSTGYVDYLDLDEAKPEVEVIAKASGSSGELAEANKKIQELTEQLDTAKGEHISRMNELLKENATLKYSAMDATELKAVLDEKGVKYGSRDGKDVLVKLVLDSEYNTQDEE